MGLISVRIQESDKRQSVLNATEKGRGQVRDCMSELDELKEAFVAPLKVSKLRELLSAINDLEKLVSYHQKKHTATLRRGT
jgi:DNA-binding MarR family transcriptional regulator